MDLFRSFLFSIFYPTTIDFKAARQDSSYKINFGYFVGLIGFMLQGLFIFPSDEINFRSHFNGLLNNIVGIFCGAVLFGLLIAFERVMVKVLKLEEGRNGLAVSYMVFGIMPLVTVPVHMILFDEVSLRGHFWIVALLIILILAWHHFIFASVISAKEKGSLDKIAILFAIEIVLAFLFLIFVPIATGNTPQIFLEEYF